MRSQPAGSGLKSGQLEFNGTLQSTAWRWSLRQRPRRQARSRFEPRASAASPRQARSRGSASTARTCASQGDEIRCERGRLSGSLGSLGTQDTRFAARRRADGGLRLSFDAFGIAGGRGRLDVELDGPRWRPTRRSRVSTSQRLRASRSPGWSCRRISRSRDVPPENFAQLARAISSHGGRRPRHRDARLRGRGRHARRRKARRFA